MLDVLLKIVVFIFGAILTSSNHCIASPPFSKHEQINYNSQASQDRFVECILYGLLGKQDNGYYLEIGASHPIEHNNTYFFEKKYGWKGVSIDIDDGYKNRWPSIRQNPLLIEDATKSDYRLILKPFPQVIDYLSLDIDTNYDIVLRKIFLNDYIFKVITIEHDFYRFGDKFRKDEREILSSLGYYLLCPDVSVFFDRRDSIFEDWWVHPIAFPPDVFTKLTSLDLKGKSHDQLINIIRKLLE
ncbi:MAG: hypothetical protein ABSA17_00975 [Rhabdochlamydiaceae bacterium]|jgi:hypothetical protein